MIAAMEAVKSGEMGANRAALEHGVSKTTLKDRISGRVKHGKNPGPISFLTNEEENELISIGTVYEIGSSYSNNGIVSHPHKFIPFYRVGKFF